RRRQEHPRGADRGAPRPRLPAGVGAALSRDDDRALPELHGTDPRPRAGRAAQPHRADDRRVRPRRRPRPRDRTAVEGLPPARRPRRDAAARPRPADPRRADVGPRPQPDRRDPRPHQAHRREEDDHPLDPHPARGRGDLRTHDHHRVRQDRGGRLRRVAARGEGGRGRLHGRGEGRRGEGEVGAAGGAVRLGRRGAPRGRRRRALPGRHARRGRRRPHLRVRRPEGTRPERAHRAPRVARGRLRATHPRGGAVTMRHALIVAWKEFRTFFQTPIAYVILFIFTVIGGFFFFQIGHFFEQREASLRPLFFYLPWFFLFLAPALSMRMWAEERRGGTIETLLTL